MRTSAGDVGKWSSYFEAEDEDKEEGKSFFGNAWRLFGNAWRLFGKAWRVESGLERGFGGPYRAFWAWHVG
jgi:hypothetical protein